MACNCCGNTSCSCYQIDYNSETGLVKRPINYDSPSYVWIDRKYPESILNCTWDERANGFVASNKVENIDPDRPPQYLGDISYFTRNGIGYQIPPWVLGYLFIDNFNGDNSWQYKNLPAPVSNITAVKLKSENDIIQKKCILKARYKIYDPTSNIPIDDIPFENEWEIIDELGFNEEIGNREIKLPTKWFMDIKGVYLQYVCNPPCFIDGDKQYDFIGAPSVMTKNDIVPNAPWDCTSWGSKDKTTETYIDPDNILNISKAEYGSESLLRNNISWCQGYAVFLSFIGGGLSLGKCTYVPPLINQECCPYKVYTIYTDKLGNKNESFSGAALTVSFYGDTFRDVENDINIEEHKGIWLVTGHKDATIEAFLKNGLVYIKYGQSSEYSYGSVVKH